MSRIKWEMFFQSSCFNREWIAATLNLPSCIQYLSIALVMFFFQSFKYSNHVHKAYSNPVTDASARH